MSGVYGVPEQVLRCQFSSIKKAGGVATHPAQCKETRAAEGGQETLSLHCTIIHRHPMAFSVFASPHKSTSVLLTQYSYCLLSKMVKCTETVTWKINMIKAKSAQLFSAHFLVLPHLLATKDKHKVLSFHPLVFCNKS